MNQVNLIGRLTKDLEVKTTQNGKSYTMFSLAVDEGFGENKRAYFPTIVVWGNTAVNCGKYLHKGSKIAVNGKLTTRVYDDQNQQKKYVTEVVANRENGVEFLDPVQKNNDGQEQEPINQSEIPF